MRMKKTLYLTGAVVAVAIIVATASSIFHKPIPKATPIPSSNVRLNLTLTNEMSEIPELSGLDKRIRNYMRK